MKAKEKAKELWQKIRQKWKDTSKKIRILILSGAAALLLVVIVVVAVQMNRHYVTLFSDLNGGDMNAVVTYLTDNGVTDYRITENNTIQVPEAQEAQLRAGLLMEGYPSSGFGYDYKTYLGNISNLTTESERKQLALMDLQERMAAVIRCLDGVEDAAVVITPAEDHTYVLDSGNTLDASASVTVKLSGGAMLTDSQVEAIQALMQTSVQGLDIENVAIIDSMGNHYSSNSTLGSLQNASQLKSALEQEQDNLARTKILQVLVPLFGQENVAVSVRTTVDVDRKVIDSTNYSMEDWAQDDGNGGKGSIGKEIFDQQVVRDAEDGAGGEVGTTTNSDLNTYVEEGLRPDGSEQVISNAGENQYLYDQENVQTEHLSGVITDMTVAVTINQAVFEGVNVNDLIPHVARAVGIGPELQDEKISILPQTFYTETAPGSPGSILDQLPPWALYAAIGGLLLFLVLLLIIRKIRRRRKKNQPEGAVQAEQPIVMAAAPPPAGADIMDMETEKSIELRQEVRKFAETSPEIAAQIVRNWLREGDEQ